MSMPQPARPPDSYGGLSASRPHGTPSLRFRAALLAPRFWGLWFGVCLLWTLSFAPNALRRALARGVAWLYPRLNRKRPRIARINLALCFPELGAPDRERLLARHLYMQAYAILDLGRLWFRSREHLLARLDIEGLAHVDAAAQSGKGVILLTGHSVALEMSAIYMSLRWEGSGMYKPFDNPLLEWLMVRSRTRFSSVLYGREEGLRPHLRILRAGGGFYYLPDEDLGRENAAFARFFGVEKATVALLGRLARLGNAWALPHLCTLDPQSGRYRLKVLPPMTSFEEDEGINAQRANDALESLIREAPDQYLWTFRLFRTPRIEGDRSPYD